MPDLIILGAGPHAQEMAMWAIRPGAMILTEIAPHARQAPGPTSEGPRFTDGAVWTLRGYLVPEAQAAQVGEQLRSGHRILGTYADLDRYPEACFALEYNCGAPALPRERITSVIAATAFVAASARIGAGCVLYPGCFVGHNTVLGDRVFALAGAIVNHDNVLEDDVTVCTNVSLAGFVTVESGTYLGQACTVRQYLRIGRGSLIGMGAVVITDVAPNSVMVGNPARHLRARVEE